MDLSKSEQPATLTTDLITWAAVHGSLRLALRHPLFPKTSRALVDAIATAIEIQLVEGGLFTREEMRRQGGQLTYEAPN